MTTLCLDFGNTRQKAALFDEATLKAVIVLTEPIVTNVRTIINDYQPQRSILSSVIHHNGEIERMLQQHTHFHKLSNTSKLPFTIPVGKPETVGADRLAIAAAAVHLFPNQHNLAIGLGSCITYNFINKWGELLGGAIAPGLEMRLRAMHQFTAKLPLVKADWNVPLIGYDTATNLQSGAVLGMAKEIDGMIEAYQNRYTNFNAVLTGGDIPFLEPHLKNKIFADTSLIFKGLYAICQVNV